MDRMDRMESGEGEERPVGDWKEEKVAIGSNRTRCTVYVVHKVQGARNGH